MRPVDEAAAVQHLGAAWDHPSFGHLVQVIRHGLKKIQYRPGLIEGCLAGTGLSLDQAEQPTDITN